MSEAMSREHFEDWNRDVFQRHAKREEEFERKVQGIEERIAGWVRAVMLAGAMITIFGGSAVGVLGWVAAEKTRRLEALHEAVISIQQTQAGMVATMSAQNAELMRQAQVDSVITANLLEINRLAAERGKTIPEIQSRVDRLERLERRR